MIPRQIPGGAVMQSLRLIRRWQTLVPSAVLLQLTACFGPDPQLFLTTSVANAVLANVITVFFTSLAGLAA
jgi:hypothetical protein